MTRLELSLRLLARVHDARLVCADVRRELGPLLADDPPVAELAELEHDLYAHDACHGFRRPLPVRTDGWGLRGFDPCATRGDA